MANIADLLDELRGHIDATRQQGNTTAIRRGIEFSKGARAVCPTVDIARRAGYTDRQAVGLQSLDRVRGMVGPLMFDNSVLHQLFSRSLERIRELEYVVDEQRKVINQVRQAVSGPLAREE